MRRTVILKRSDGMLKKTINIDGKDVEFKASAAVPRIYRLMFGRNIFRDMTRMARNLKKEQKKAQEESGAKLRGVNSRLRIWRCSKRWPM